MGLGVQLWSPSVFSAPEQNPGLGACTREYYSFLGDVRTPAESTLAFKDFFRPYCQVVDILKLEDELRALRTAFLDHAMSCSDTTNDRIRYQELVMELYFVRRAHNLDSSSIQDREAPDPASVQAVRMQQLRVEMKNLFVDEENRVTEENLNALFETWLTKYEDRLARYVGCDEGPWEEVSTVFVSFVTQMQNLNEDLETLKHLKIEKRPAQDLFSSAFEVDKAEFSEWIPIAQNAYAGIEAIRELKDTKIPPALTPADLANLGGPVSLETALEALSSDAVNVNIQLNQNDRLARYTVLYGYGGSLAGANFAASVAGLNSTLEAINTVHLPAIQTQVDQASAKQCQ